MRILIIPLLVLISCNAALCQGALDTCLLNNQKLINDLDSIQNERDSLEIEFDLLNVKYQNLYQKHIKLTKRFRLLQKEKQKLDEELEKFRKDSTIRENKIRELTSKINELNKSKKSDTEQLRKLTLERNRYNRESIEKGNLAFKTRQAFDDSQESLLILEQDIKRLEDEASDRISISNQKVFLDSTWYSYGEEILFIPFPNGENYSITLNPDLDYRLLRLSKLISKYDFGVRILLVGESSNSLRSKRVEHSKNRTANLKDYLLLNNILTDTHFAKERFEEELKRVGVSIRVVKRRKSKK